MTLTVPYISPYLTVSGLVKLLETHIFSIMRDNGCEYSLIRLFLAELKKGEKEEGEGGCSCGMILIYWTVRKKIGG